VADNGILNQTQVHDPAGDSGGADLSSLTVASYADNTLSLSVGFANRDLLHPGETVQMFVDVNDDGKEDVNLSIWPTGLPSYLDHWTGTEWVDVRQLPELVQTDGAFSVRLDLAELRGAAAVPVGSSIGVAVGAWTVDSTTGNPRPNADDWLPDDRSWIQHQIAPPAAPPPTTTTTPAPTTPAKPGPAPPRLAVVCVRHTLRATVTPANGSNVVSVSFFANGALRLKDTVAPYVAIIPTKGLRAPISVVATIRLPGKTQTIRTLAHPC
jgi:hypothetical protein